MTYLNKIFIFLLTLALTTQLYGSALASFGLGYIVAVIHLIGLIFFLIYNIRYLRYHQIDILFIFFSLIFLFSSIYTINDDYTTETILFIILPLYYFNGKLLISRNCYKNFIVIFITIVFMVDIYVLNQLFENNFLYHKYYTYSDAILKLDYLTMSLFTLVSLIFQYNFKVFKIKLLDYGLILFFIIMILISGSRFSILFLLFSILIYILNLSVVKQNYVLLLFIFTAFIISSSTIYSKKVESIFSYSILRISNITNNDKSLNNREVIINEAFSKIDDKPFIGYGINSSENLLSQTYVHNMLLETWLETGIFNFLNLMTLLSIILYMSWKIYRKKLFLSKALIFINVYLVLSYLKSFSVAEGKILFFMFGITTSMYYAMYRKNNKRRTSNET